MSEDGNIDPNKTEEATQGAKALEEQLKKLAKAYAELDKGVSKANSGLSKTAAAIKEAEGAGESMGNVLGGLVGTNSGFSSGIQNMVGNLGNADKMFKGFTKSLTANFNVMAIGLAAVEKMAEATIAMVYATDQALVSFNKQTGAARLYGSQIQKLERANYNYGITIDDAAESMGGLVGGIQNFNTLAPDAQYELLETTGILNEMGVEAGVTAQSLHFLINSMGMSEEAAAQTTREMFTLAQALGRPPQEMASAFNAAQPQLAAFGNRSVEVFNKMAINASRAGMEVADMLRITEQFDKFDTAANAVGKLNAALGGPYLSTIKMVTTTDPTDRLKMMSGAAREAGKSFDDMEYYERKMLASAMGLKDVNELALVMANRFDLVEESVERSSEDIIALRKQTQDFNTIMEEFAQIGRTLVIDVIGPLIKGLKMLANGITYLAQSPLTWMGSGLAIVGAGMIALTVATGGVGAVVAAVVGIIAGFIVVLKGVYDFLGGFDTVTKIAEGVMSKFGPVIDRISESFSRLMGEGEGFFSMLSLNEAQIETFIDYMVDTIGNILYVVEVVLMAVEAMGGLKTIMAATSFIWGPLAVGLGVVAAAVTVAVAPFIALFDILGRIGHAINVGMSPSILSTFGFLTDAVTFLGDALMFPFEMLMKLITAFKDLAGLLAGKALGFISSAISYVFGGSPSAEVNNGGFNRGEDMDAMAVSIGEEVGKAVKEALQDMQMNNKVQLEVVSKHGLPTLFDFVQKNLDDVASGRPPNIALNASRAGIV